MHDRGEEQSRRIRKYGAKVTSSGMSIRYFVSKRESEADGMATAVDEFGLMMRRIPCAANGVAGAGESGVGSGASLT